MTWVDLLGWAGSALLVFSIMQVRALRFRVLNLVACVVLIVFNALLAVWPGVGMNVVLAAINAWFIVRLLGERHDASAYAVLEVAEDDTYLRHFLTVEAEQISRFFPRFRPAVAPTRRAWLVQHGNETAGVVVVADGGAGLAQVELDYVTEKFRDLTPGEFVYRRSSLFAGHGWTRVRTPDGMVGPYYERLGFTREGDAWTLDLTRTHPV